MPQIATIIAPHPYERLRRLAHQGQVNYASIIERALLAYAPAESLPAPDVEIIHAALEPVLARLAELENRSSELEEREVRSALELAAALERMTARLAALEAPVAPAVPATHAEASVESRIAEIGVPVASTAITEPAAAEPESSVPVKILAEMPGVERAKAVATMRDMRRRGLSYLKIGVAMFKDHGVATDGGKPLWPGTVQKIIDG